MSQHDDKHRKSKKIVVIEKVRDKYGSVIDTFTYVFVLLLSRFFLGEKITKGKLTGNLIIIIGILIYSKA